MDVINFIKSEFSNWTNFEKISLVLLIFVILLNAFIVGDSPVAVISAICSLFYTIIAGKGRISCYFFGLIGAVFYIYLSFSNKLYGNVLLYVLYYIPMFIAGIFKWKKQMNKELNSVIKTSLTIKEKLIYIILMFGLSFLSVKILTLTNDVNPVIDGVIFAISIFGMLLTVKRCIEQWVIWFAVNVLSVVLWSGLLIKGEKVYATVIMWAIYVVLSVYFYLKWQKELNN